MALLVGLMAGLGLVVVAAWVSMRGERAEPDWAPDGADMCVGREQEEER